MPSSKRTIVSNHPIDLAGTWRGVARGPQLPSTRVGDDVVSRAFNTPEGPATIRFVAEAPDAFEATAWGPGRDYALDNAPAMIGAADDDRGFSPDHPLVSRLWRRFGNHRIPRTGSVAETLVLVVLEQRVTIFEARRAQSQITRRWGELAPGPEDLVLPPHPDTLADVAYYDLHVLGVEQRRADTVRRVAAASARLDALVDATLDEAWDRLLSIPGVGLWSTAETTAVALGDADAVPVGDAHLPSDVTWALTGEAVDDDEAMLAALEPFRGQRARVLRLLAAAGVHAPRRGPRYAPRDLRRS